MPNIGVYITTYTGIKNKAEQFRFMLMQCFVFTLPFDMIFSSALLILLAVTTFFDLSYEKVKSIPKPFIIFQVVYLLSLSGYVYSFHKSNAGFILEKQMALFLFPLIIPLAINLNQDKIKFTLITLSISSFFSILFLFTCVFWNVLFDLQVPFFSTLSSGMFFNHQFSQPLGIHAGYLSLYVSLSIVFIIRNFKKEFNPSFKVLLVAILMVLLVGLFFLASRNSIIAVSFILLFVMPFFRLKKKAVYFALITLAVFLSFLILNKVPYLKERFSSEMILDMNSSLGMNTANNFKVLEPRFDRWLATIELIKKSPLIGFGTGDEEQMLKTAYMKHGLYISFLLEFNAHNQYLSILVKHGLIGLVVFLAALFYYFKLAIASRDFMYISFLLLICIGFFTENILDANKGIFFFAFFNALFGFKCLLLNQNDTETQSA